MMEKCETCRFSISAAYANCLLCRRFPVLANVGAHPEVNHNDWCGEYQPIPKTVLGRKKKK